MAEAKIDIRVGAVSFSGEGEDKWLSEQLDKLLEKIPELANIAPAETSEGSGTANSGTGTVTKVKSGTLATFLKEKKATSNQVRKFLATALWLEDHDDKETLTTKEVTNALSHAKQGALTNPSQCLANNVSQGFCQKKGKRDFFVTDEGRAEIGE